MFAVSDCCVNKINSDWTACVMQDVDSYVFGINLFAHSDITIDVLTQKSLLQDVKLYTNPLYKYTQKIKIIEY